jgi:hypothetical protein
LTTVSTARAFDAAFCGTVPLTVKSSTCLPMETLEVTTMGALLEHLMEHFVVLSL